MPLSSYAELQTSVMDWLARPGDPLLAPAVPDMILMFEEEARDRLQSRFTEAEVDLIPDPNTNWVLLPDDYGELRSLSVDTASGRRHFTYQTPRNMDMNIPASGFPAAYTIEGLYLSWTGNAGDPPPTLILDYMQGIPPLSNTVTTNWLLAQYPSAYLFGTLSFAAPYIGDDPRLQLWLSAREAAIERIRLADRRAKFPHGLMIQTDVRNP